MDFSGSGCCQWLHSSLTVKPAMACEVNSLLTAPMCLAFLQGCGQSIWQTLRGTAAYSRRFCATQLMQKVLITSAGVLLGHRAMQAPLHTQVISQLVPDCKACPPLLQGCGQSTRQSNGGALSLRPLHCIPAACN